MSDIILGTQEDYEEDEEAVPFTLNSKEIYLKIAQNIELINLYAQINEQICKERQQSTIFINVTETLSKIKETLERIEIKISF